MGRCLTSAVVFFLFVMINVFFYFLAIPIVFTRNVIELQQKSPVDVVIRSPDTFILNPDVCSYRQLDIVICVEIRRTSFDGRKTIRETWGSYGVSKSGPIALLFFLGSAKENENSEVQESINEEFRQNRDIVQGDFIDDYSNLTLKSLSVYHWAAEHCRHSGYILKSDDDMYVNVPLLIAVLKKVSRSQENKPFVIGKILKGVRPIRNEKSKWYVSPLDFPHKKFPDYAVGGAYAMTGSAAAALRDAASSVPFIRVEDQFQGLCANYSKTVVIHENRFHTYKVAVDGGVFVHEICGGHYSQADMRKVYSELVGMGVKY